MNVSTQIRKYRIELKLSQEELAEKIYVTRQTVSNWENGKNYPDIHSLLLLSSLFNLSLDHLIKGDVEIMKNEIKDSEIKELTKYGKVFTILLCLTIVSAVPLVKWLHIYGAVVWAALFAVTLYIALKIERVKKTNDIQTYKEIVAFTQGKRLDEPEVHQEFGKRSYQKVFLAAAAAVLTLLVCFIFIFLIK